MKFTLFPQFPDKLTEPEVYEAFRKKLVFSLFTIIGIPLFIGFSISEFYSGEFREAVADGILGIYLIVILILARMLKNPVPVYRTSLVLIFAGILLMLYSGADDGAEALWLFAIPPISFFLFGRKEGLIQTCGATAVIFIVFYLPGMFPGPPYNYDPSFKIRFLLSFIVLSTMAFIYESVRQIIYERMMKKQHDLGQQQKQLDQAYRKVQVLLKEVNHRVKNNLNMVSSLINLYGRDEESRMCKPRFDELREKIHAISLIHEKLYKGTDFTTIDFSAYITQISGEMLSALTDKVPEIEIDIPRVQFSTDLAIPLALIFTELLSNALKYGISEGSSLSISLDSIDGQYRFSIKNTGYPFPEDVDIQNPSTLGLRLVKALTEQIAGTVALERERGTQFTISFPENE